MYKIIGSDQKEYGPVTAEQNRQWITQGRVNARTQTQAEGGAPGAQGHDAFNARLDGKEEGAINPNTVMIFETDDGWNVSGGPDRMLGQPRHAGQFVVAFADGSVQQLSPARLQELRWEP